jgi:hypothetical protein
MLKTMRTPHENKEIVRNAMLHSIKTEADDNDDGKLSCEEFIIFFYKILSESNCAPESVVL